MTISLDLSDDPLRFGLDAVRRMMKTGFVADESYDVHFITKAKELADARYDENHDDNWYLARLIFIVALVRLQGKPSLYEMSNETLSQSCDLVEQALVKKA